MPKYYRKVKYIFIVLILFFVLCVTGTNYAKNNDIEEEKPNNIVNVNNNNSQPDTLTSTPNPPSVEPENKYFTVNVDNEKIYDGELVLVNSNYECKFNGKNIISLINYKNSSYLVADGDVMLNSGNSLDALNSMMETFFQNTGLDNVIISCGFRDIDYQRKLYEREIANLGEEGKKWVAKPGYSEHQTGYTFDLSLLKNGLVEKFDGNGQYNWINENCKYYGYILRYPADKTDITMIYNEEWHFRYVGIPHAIYITENNLCFEEYIDYIKNISIKNPLNVSVSNAFNDNQNHNYQIYYVEASEGTSTNIPLPNEDCNYSISGNNIDGFIVTIDNIV